MATPVEVGGMYTASIATNIRSLCTGVRVLLEACRHRKTVVAVQNGCLDGIGFEEHESTHICYVNDAAITLGTNCDLNCLVGRPTSFCSLSHPQIFTDFQQNF